MESYLIIVKEYEFDKPNIHKIDSIMDSCIRNCQNKLLHTFKYRCFIDIKLTNIGNSEIVTLTISDKSMLRMN